jgi:hypothetical protein
VDDTRGRTVDDPPATPEPRSTGDAADEPAATRRRLRSAVRARLGVDRRALAAFRIALGCILLLDLALRARNLTAFYTDAGVLPRAALATASPLAARLSLHALSGATWAVGALFVVAGVAAVALAVGYRTRLATAVSLLLLASLQARNPFVLNAGDTLLWQLVGAGLLCPLGARWSVDAVRRRGAFPDPSRAGREAAGRFFGPASALLLAVTVVVYVANAVEKFRGTAWLEGAAVERVFRLTYLHGPLGGYLPETPALLSAATYGWLALLVASPLLVASAGRLRAGLAGSLLAAHLSMALTLQIGVFPLISAAALLPVFPPFVWDRVEEAVGPAAERTRAAAERTRAAAGPAFGRSRRAVEFPDRATAERAAAVVALVLLASLLAWNGMTLGLVDAPEPVETATDPTDYGWKMFAPDPPTVDALLLATATSADGERVDALYGDPVAADRPPSDARAYPTARWRKYVTLLAAAESPERVDALLAHLCDRPGRGAVDDAASVTVSMAETDVSEGGETRVRELGTRRCRPGEVG